MNIIYTNNSHLFLLLIGLIFVSCSSSADSNITLKNPPPIISGDWYRPTPKTSWQWQLQGKVNTQYQVEIYDIDLFETSISQIQQLQKLNKKVICYFSAGSYESFRPYATDFLFDDLGKTLDGYDDEKWLDIRSNNVTSIMKSRLDLAASKGCDGVEPDNMDGYANDSGFPLTAQDQLIFNRFIANEAHQRGLAVGLKNDLDQIPELVQYYDFAVNEQCFEFDECNALAPFVKAGKAVLNAEYLTVYATDADARNRLCAKADALLISSLIMPIELDDRFRISCK